MSVNLNQKIQKNFFCIKGRISETPTIPQLKEEIQKTARSFSSRY